MADREASMVKWRLRIAESYSSSIRDDGNDGILGTLQTTSDSELLSRLPKSRTYASTDISFVQAHGHGGRSLLTK